ncbi:acetate--CoA ligase [Endozoicomonadaceae bacterium StTr2]
MPDYCSYPVDPALAANARVNARERKALYQQSVNDPDGFWREQAACIDWFRPFTTVKNTSWEPGNISIKWYEDGTTNVSWNCIDRHLESRGDQIAIYWEPDEPGPGLKITYRELHQKVCRLANVLKSLGVGKGDVVAIYMPMVVETVVAMQACARIGAIHSVVFGGFSPEALAGRIVDSSAKVILTANEGVRGGKRIPLKHNVDEALQHQDITSVQHVLVLKHTDTEVAWNPARDLDWQTCVDDASDDCPPEEMEAEAPLFILYTSGSTGKPKGLLHTTGGYLTYVTMTFRYVFDYREGDIFWCNADAGWITGHTYLAYGPLSNGATVVIHEGVPNYPSTNRMSEIVDRYRVNILYTAPTAIRALMAKGEAAIEGTDRSSLRLLGTVGEPINPEAWVWYRNTIGNERCPVIDTWWQTETGAAMIAPLPGANTLKPGSATEPLFGIRPALVDNDGQIQQGACSGNLVILDSWPGQARTIYGDHQRFEQTYFSTFKGMYCTGDGARRDEDNDYWITGRVDDVLNVSGHRMGTAEIESALVSHPAVAEAAVVGYPHAIKGQGIYAYVSLMQDAEFGTELEHELRKWVEHEIGAIAKPDILQHSPGLPKTRSGKIMRRILRKIANGEYDHLGDTSTLADPSVVTALIGGHSDMTAA